MARTQQEYADEYYLKGKAQAEERYKQRQENDEKQIQTMTNTVQKATEAQVQPYQTQMEELPDPYRELHDANALAEMVGQRQVKEAMANMGLSDSGLNRTQMTALAVQRGNADADLRRDRQRRTQELQDRIAHIRNTGQLEIEQQTAAIRGETDNWYNTALDTAYTNAQALGASAYAADQKVAQAQLQFDAAQLQDNAAQKVRESAASYAQAQKDNQTFYKQQKAAERRYNTFYQNISEAWKKGEDALYGYLTDNKDWTAEDWEMVQQVLDDMKLSDFYYDYKSRLPVYDQPSRPPWLEKETNISKYRNQLEHLGRDERSQNLMLWRASGVISEEEYRQLKAEFNM